MSAAAESEEVCANCGGFVNRLLPATGWCWDCSQAFVLGLDSKDIRICISCGKASTDTSHSTCRPCRREEWLKKHADEIERFMAKGFSFAISKDLVRIHFTEQRKCLCCGAFMKKAPRGENYFCTTNKECKAAQRKFKWQMYKHHVPREKALKIVLDSLPHE